MAGDSAVVLVRLRAGVVGETRRSVHVVPFSAASRDGVMVAYCGLPIVPFFAEYLETLQGMPCELCVARAAMKDSFRSLSDGKESFMAPRGA
jgi:hypothetical protein